MHVHVRAKRESKRVSEFKRQRKKEKKRKKKKSGKNLKIHGKEYNIFETIKNLFL